MYRPNYSVRQVPKTLAEIEQMDVSDDEEEETSSVYSYKSTKSNISEVTLPQTLRQPTSGYRIPESQFLIPLPNQPKSLPIVQENQQEEEDVEEEIYEALSEDNPEFLLFKEETEQWIQLDDEIKVLQKALNERKKAKNAITPHILEFMGKYEIENMNMHDSSALVYTKSVTTKPLTKDYVKAKLTEYLRNAQKADKLTHDIYSNREKQTTYRIKRNMKK
jgi:hypothetical protein